MLFRSGRKETILERTSAALDLPGDILPLVVRVRGEGLELRAMDPARLLITGRISMVELA